MQHHLLTMLFGGRLHLAPLENPRKILDLGTGTGIWAIDMADMHPGATVIGTDLSPNQPQWVPENVHFEIDDIEGDWMFSENSFDYIHDRMLIGSVSDWKTMFKKAYKHCKPGGYFEVQELDPRFRSDDDTLPPDSTSKYWGDLICEAAGAYNRYTPKCREYKAWVEEAGFVDVTETIFKRPLNSWPKNKTLKEIGKFQLMNYTEGLEGLTIGLLTRALHWQPAEVQVLLAKVRAELRDKSIHSYQNVAVVYGRKPLNEF